MEDILTSNPALRHWSTSVAQEVMKRFPKQKRFTCAAGISPSGVVHFGNLRDIFTSFLVAQALREEGKEVRLLFSWDDFVRLRKIPEGVDPSYREYIGRALTAVPDPIGNMSSYAERFEQEFERSIETLSIELEYRYQTKEYTSGRYDEQIIHALNHRRRIAEILLSFMSEKAVREKQIDREEYLDSYYPLSVYSRFTGKDTTTVLSFDGVRTLRYRCRETGLIDEIDLRSERRAKLPWKIDWPMRWSMEEVNFEPGGPDHASPGGSYEIGQVISQEIFSRPAPVFQSYEWIGIQGLGSKMSGSKGNAVTPGMLLELYEPELLKWLYAARHPQQPFTLCFDSEVYRQYDEFDREKAAFADGTLSPVATLSLRRAGTPQNFTRPIPFRQAVGLGQIVQWDYEKMVALCCALGESFSEASIRSRLSRARTWVERYNREQMIQCLDGVNDDYLASMSIEAKALIRRLAERLKGAIVTIAELEELVYGIPKDPHLSQKENAPRQRAFFKDVYHLLIGKDTGPRLSTFLWALPREKVLGLLLVDASK